MIHLFSILYLSWALWRRDWALYEFDGDVFLTQKRNDFNHLLFDIDYLNQNYVYIPIEFYTN